MNITKRAILFSTALHLFYFVGTFGIGFIRTLNYEPDIIAESNNLTTLQSEVVIGITESPLIYVFTWIGLTIVLALGLFLAQHGSQKKRKSTLL